MPRKRIYIYSVLALAVLLMWLFSTSQKQDEQFTEVVKIAMRDAGNELLLANQDSTSLVLPIKRIEPSKYELKFKSQLYIEPDTLVTIVQNSFAKANLPMHYRVEVIQCSDNEVAYSFEMFNDVDSDIIPCKTRVLPQSCYAINVRFVKRTSSFVSRSTLLYIFIGIVIVFLLDLLLSRKKEIAEASLQSAYETIGSYKFYPEQNKLVKEPVEIALSRKECELLEIFAASPNQIIKRDDLTKRVWEDNGVIVGRSLDTYISKLRKKLKDDDSIKITNVHGIGYKLEVS